MNTSKVFLATTALKTFWDTEIDMPIILGPWCLLGEDRKKEYTLLSSPWRPAIRIKEAADYCYQAYKRLITHLTEQLNSIHQVSYPERYWQTLIGFWLLHFIEVSYERFVRIEKALELYPDFYTYILAPQECSLSSIDTADFLSLKVNDDYYNLKLFSLIINWLCPQKAVIKNGYPDSSKDNHIPRQGIKKMIFHRTSFGKNVFLKNKIILVDMYHLTSQDKLRLRYKIGFRNISFADFPSVRNGLCPVYSDSLRKNIVLSGAEGNFERLLYSLIPSALPGCYVENYKSYMEETKKTRNTGNIKFIGSSTGWYFNERFKFFAAETSSPGVRFVDFQHGGGYGSLLSLSAERLQLEQGIFYTWGWSNGSGNATRTLPSPHLSRMKNKHCPKLDNVLLVGMSLPRYHHRFYSISQPDDMPGFLKDMGIFSNALSKDIKAKIIYRPFSLEYGWGERELVKRLYPQAEFIKNGGLPEWLKKVRLAVIDHAHTSYIEALTINVPTVLYWNHDVYLMRKEAQGYFELLKNAGILYQDPESAAKKVNEVYENPDAWWKTPSVQHAREEFCRRYAFTDKNWLKFWSKELRKLANE